MKKLLLALRKARKAKKPDFIRQDSHKKARLGDNWRKPRGLQSKMRLQKAGYRAIVKTGYKSPAEVRGLDASGLKPVKVSNVKDLEGIDSKSDGVLISRSVGRKNKLEIVKKAIESKIAIINVKDPQAFVKEIEDQIASKKKESKEKKETRDKKKIAAEKEAEKEAKKKEAEEKKEKESETSEGETKEKKDLDKVLTQKEM